MKSLLFLFIVLLVVLLPASLAWLLVAVRDRRELSTPVVVMSLQLGLILFLTVAFLF